MHSVIAYRRPCEELMRAAPIGPPLGFGTVLPVAACRGWGSGASGAAGGEEGVGVRVQPIDHSPPVAPGPAPNRPEFPEVPDLAARGGPRLPERPPPAPPPPAGGRRGRGPALAPGQHPGRH